jgi:lipopolysaccharide transport system permease protein
VATPLPSTEQIQRDTSATPVLFIRPRSTWLEFRLAELWRFRELMYFFVWRDVKIRYKQTLLGLAWVIVQPLLTMLVFTIFFGRLAKMPSQGLPYPEFYLAAVVPWAYFSNALLSVTNIVVENQRVITKVYFPRLVLPLSAALSGLVDFFIGFLVLMVFTLSYGLRPSFPILLMPLFLLLAVMTVLGVGLWLSALNALYRDVRYLIPFLVQFWMLASPVAYPSSMVPGRWRWVYGLNPMVGVIEGFRWALTGKVPSPGPALYASIAIVCVLVFGGLLFFNRMEGAIADRV